ncbi:MAG: hypothetical protein QOF27_3002, partial [Gaiellaceae bacterium]|nr:hypothetical protein [Gaiellaceae bacterium]
MSPLHSLLREVARYTAPGRRRIKSALRRI